MSHRSGHTLRFAPFFACLVTSFCLLPARLEAAEPFQQFLDGLREQALYDVALDYLTQMETSPVATPAIREVIPYEQARTMIEAARIEKDSSLRKKQLDVARDKLEQFLKSHSNHPLVGSAAMQLGNVIVERGRMALESSNRPSQAANKQALLVEARGHFAAAQKVFDEADAKFSEKLASFPKYIDLTNPKNKPQGDARDLARRDSIQSQLYAAAVVYESAKTYPEGSPEAKKLLQAAADKYEKTYQAHRTRLAGLLARIKQGQCYQDMGDRRRALGLYSDILQQPDQEEFRKLKATALYLSLQCWTDPSEKKDELAVIKGEDWLARGRGLEDRQPDWLAIRYYTALAHKQFADSLKPTEAAKKTQELNAARDHANKVAKLPGPYQDGAKALVKQITGLDLSGKEPATFVEAVERGKMALDDMATKYSQIKIAPTMRNEKEIPNLQKGMEEDRAKALKNFELAMRLRDDSTPIDDVNNVRYYLCFLNYQIGHFYDAAVMGEFIARKYPKSAGARPAAKIALAGYLQGYNEGTADKSFDRQRMLELAEYISKHWPTESESEEAWAILMAVYTGEHDLTKAAQCLSKIPEASAQRGTSELKLGQAYWAEYLISQRKEGEDRLPQSQLDALVAEAQKLLETGMKRLRPAIDAGGPATIELATAGLSLAQIYVGNGQPQKAVAVLEDPKLGPLVLVKQKSPIVEQNDFPIETYKVALRAYVGTQTLDQAEAIMDHLDQLASAKGEAGQADLTKIYISLGRGLEDQVTTLRKANKPAEMQTVAQAFEKFLQRISERENGNNFSSLNWVSETFFSLGSGYDTHGTKVPPEAAAYFQKTLDTDQRILDACKRDPKFAPSADSVMAIEIRTARCLRRMDKYKEALDLLEKVLVKKPQLLDGQTEAAYTYMDWGAENPAYYSLAILGARKKDPNNPTQNVFWGWSKIAGALQLEKNYQAVYHEARLNVARCRLLQAQSKQGAEKAEMLSRAAYEIYITNRIKPDLGGPVTRDEYDQLLKTIQKLQGEKPLGLKVFEKGAESAQASAAK